jgi:2-hydroxychromene-2-carboxylate isomerase
VTDAEAFRFSFADPRDLVRAETAPRDVLWVPGCRPAGAPETSLEEIAKQLAEHGLLELRPPARFPFDDEAALLAATYAQRIGKCIVFSLALFRQCYYGGRSLEEVDTLVIAGAAAEIHPRAIKQALELQSIRDALDANSAAAA